jgi:predicted amidophosphoribosyltransferase
MTKCFGCLENEVEDEGEYCPDCDEQSSRGYCPVCGYDFGRESHNHCPNCRKVCSSMGHYDPVANRYTCDPNRG